MKIGTLVKHWREDLGLGLVVETVDENKMYEANHKVLWPDGEWGWYTTCRLQKAAKCKQAIQQKPEKAIFV